MVTFNATSGGSVVLWLTAGPLITLAAKEPGIPPKSTDVNRVIDLIWLPTTLAARPTSLTVAASFGGLAAVNGLAIGSPIRLRR